MSSVALFLVTIASIFLLGTLGEIVFKRTNVPDALWLILAGVVVGPVLELISREQLIAVAPYFAPLTLMVVLFEGGSRLNLADLSTAAPRSVLLALLTFATAVTVVALFSAGTAAVGGLPASWTWKHGLLLGCILGGSSSIIIMPAMGQARVEPKVANLIGLESAFTDAFCVVGASALMDLMGAGIDSSPGVALARSFGIGLALGGGIGLVWLALLRPLSRSEHGYPVTLSALLLLYVAIERAGGSAALGILAFAVILGNAGRIGKRVGLGATLEIGADVRGFHSQMTFIVKSFFFTFIGAMLAPPWSLIVIGWLLGGILLLARIPGAWLALLGSGLTRGQQRLVVVAMPRGMAAGVLATLPATAGIDGTAPVATVVFATVLMTILIFALGFPLARRRPPAALLAMPSPACPSDTARPEPSESQPEAESAMH